jgi:hypothetical protein
MAVFKVNEVSLKELVYGRKKTKEIVVMSSKSSTTCFCS